MKRLGYCANCKYAVASRDPRMLECHRHHPTAEAKGDKVLSYYPMVSSAVGTVGCGDYEEAAPSIDGTTWTDGHDHDPED